MSTASKPMVRKRRFVLLDSRTVVSRRTRRFYSPGQSHGPCKYESFALLGAYLLGYWAARKISQEPRQYLFITDSFHQCNFLGKFGGLGSYVLPNLVPRVYYSPPQEFLGQGERDSDMRLRIFTRLASRPHEFQGRIAKRARRAMRFQVAKRRCECRATRWVINKKTKDFSESLI